ncbi:MAG TPA: hypothetical protein VK702_02175 [Candidatus Acidoferrum sp.]|nr:hypothetical protein [Candidatus Acidoferrum sp.]
MTYALLHNGPGRRVYHGRPGNGRFDGLTQAQPVGHALNEEFIVDEN